MRSYDHDLTPAFCAKMVELFHSAERFQTSNGGASRAGLEQSAWTELNVTRLSEPGFLGFFRTRMDAALQRYNADVGPLPIAVPNSPHSADLILKRYAPGGNDRFQVHFDSVNEVSDRYLVFLWFLNDVQQGGETQFPQLGLKFEARAGRLLVFPPYWMFQHAGLAPLTSDKYILSTYLLFPRRQAV